MAYLKVNLNINNSILCDYNKLNGKMEKRKRIGINQVFLLKEIVSIK